MTVQLESLSNTLLAPFNQTPASQKFMIDNPQGDSLRMRFIVQYEINGAHVSEEGTYAS